MVQPSLNISFWEHQTFINRSNFVVVGSGIVGLSTAIHLKERNPTKKVTVLEKGILPSGASTKNAGFACVGSPSEILDDLNASSEDEVMSIVKRRWDGLNLLRKNLGDDKIEYLQLGSYELFSKANSDVFDNTGAELNRLNKLFEAYIGIKNVFEIDDEIINKNSFSDFNRAISHKAEGQIDTGKMMASLIELAHEKGVVILNGVDVIEISKSQLSTNLGVINFDKCAICTNGFAKQFLASEDIEPARAQVVITHPINDLKIKGIYHFDKGYYYFRNIGNRILFGGARNLDFETENTTKLENTSLIIDQLKHILSTKILPNNEVEIERTWAGVMGVGNVKSPIIKKIDENIYCGVRLGGMGVAIGSLVGKELAELILEE